MECDFPMNDDLRTQISDALDRHWPDRVSGGARDGCLCEDFDAHLPWPDHAARVVTDLLIDLAGRGELLKAMDRMYR